MIPTSSETLGAWWSVAQATYFLSSFCWSCRSSSPAPAFFSAFAPACNLPLHVFINLIRSAAFFSAFPCEKKGFISFLTLIWVKTQPTVHSQSASATNNRTTSGSRSLSPKVSQPSPLPPLSFLTLSPKEEASRTVRHVGRVYWGYHSLITEFN